MDKFRFAVRCVVGGALVALLMVACTESFGATRVWRCLLPNGKWLYTNVDADIMRAVACGFVEERISIVPPPPRPAVRPERTIVREPCTADRQFGERPDATEESEQ